MSKASASMESDVRDLLQRILRLRDQPCHGLVRADVAEWDSLKHMEIVFALEDRYSVRFDESEFSALDSPAAIATLLQRHLAT
jgi:acyl carrier protein